MRADILTGNATESTVNILVQSNCMRNLCAPWRMSYLEAEADAEAEDCLFCRVFHEIDSDDGNLIIYRGDRLLAMLNRYPYTNGHMLLVPALHVPSLEDLPADVMTELALLSQTALRALRDSYGAEGFNIGVNIGAAGGAGIADHVHMHVMPRWAGDTNFMTTVAETRIVPEELVVTHRRLRDLMAELLMGGD